MIRKLILIQQKITFIIFFRDIFQKKALVIRRGVSDYFKGFFSTSDFIEMIQKVVLSKNF